MIPSRTTKRLKKFYYFKQTKNNNTSYRQNELKQYFFTVDLIFKKISNIFDLNY